MQHMLKPCAGGIAAIVLSLAVTAAIAEQPAGVRGPLQVASSRRYLQDRDGTPFFYLGDTAWELFHRLNR